jgi:hypothetical protein
MSGHDDSERQRGESLGWSGSPAQGQDVLEQGGRRFVITRWRPPRAAVAVVGASLACLAIGYAAGTLHARNHEVAGPTTTPPAPQVIRTVRQGNSLLMCPGQTGHAEQYQVNASPAGGIIYSLRATPDASGFCIEVIAPTPAPGNTPAPVPSPP